MRARSLPLLVLTVSGAFATGWLLARLNRDTTEGTRSPSVSSAAGTQNLNSGVASDKAGASIAGLPGTGNFPDVLDPLVRAALHNPDLAAAVREIMARQEEDHCADTRFVQLVETLPESRLAELPALLEAFSGDEYVTKFILMPWAERQPAAALAWAESQGAKAGDLFPPLLTGWARRDPDAAAAWMEGLPLSTRSRDLQTTLIGTLAESDPDRALSLLREKGWTTNADAIQSLLKNQGAVNPAAALETLRSLVAEFDAGSREVSEFPEPVSIHQAGKLHPQFNSLLGALLSGASNRSASDFSSLLSRLSPQEIKDGASSLFLEGLNLHPELIESLARNADGSEQNRALFRGLAGNDGQLALSLLEKISDPSLRVDTLRSINWDSNDRASPHPALDGNPQARRAVLETLEALSGPERTGAEKQLVHSLAARSPQLAVEIWNRLDPGAQLERGAMVLKAMAEGPGLQTAVDLWKSSSAPLQAATLRGLAAGLGASNPMQGVELAMSQPDPKLRMESLAVTLSFWSDRDSSQAAAEMERLLPQLDLPLFQEALKNAGRFTSGGMHHHISTGRHLNARLQALLPAP